MENKEKIQVVYCCNLEYLDILKVSIYSLLSNSDENSIVIHLLTDKLPLEIVNSFENFVNRLHGVLNYIEYGNYFDNIRNWNIKDDSKYARLFLGSILTVDKVIYLDADTLIVDNLWNLWNVNITDYYIAAVQDTSRKEGRLEAGLDPNELYFNSGVLLINLKYWKSSNIEKQFLAFKKDHQNIGLFNDQRVLNGVLKKKVFWLSPGYNLLIDMILFNHKKIKKMTENNTFYSDDVLKNANKNPCIIHFAGLPIYRPWFKHCKHPYRLKYREIMTKLGIHEKSVDKCGILKYYLKAMLPFPIFNIVSAYSIKRIVLHNKKLDIKKMEDEREKNSNHTS